VADEALTQSYIDMYLIPFLERYGSNEYLWSVDLMNEPDWVVENRECGQIKWEIMSKFFARCAAAVHNNSDVLVTVGIGVVKYNSDEKGFNRVSDEYLKSLGGENAYLDFYSTHYYYWQNPWFGYAPELSPAQFGLDGSKPCVIGEIAADGEDSGRNSVAQEESAYKNGWNGIMAWTSNGVDDCGGFDDVKPAAEHILTLAGEAKIFPLGR
jgi:hypothetical protein